MGDWRAMGSNARRRMGAPSYHGGGAAPDYPASPPGPRPEDNHSFLADKPKPPPENYSLRDLKKR